MAYDIEVTTKEDFRDIGGIAKLILALEVFNHEVEADTRITTTVLGKKGAEILRRNIPIGETGNLHRAVGHYLEAVPAALIDRHGAGQGYVTKIFIDDKRAIPRPRPSTPFGPQQTDPPTFYALKVDQGRRALFAGIDKRSLFPKQHIGGDGANKFFAWFNPKRPPKTKDGDIVSKYNTFRRALRPVEGVYFMRRTYEELSIYTESVELTNFIRRLRRGGLGSRQRAALGASRFLGDASQIGPPIVP